MPGTRKRFIKVISTITLWAFLFTIGIGETFTGTSWAADPAPVLGNIAPLEAGDLEAPTEFNFDTVSLPPHLGTIGELLNTHSDRIVIHIQDAHCNYAAQHKIAGIISYLNRKYGINMVNLEGGSGKYDLSIFDNIGDQRTRERIADHFVKEGIVNGAEYFAINNPDKVTLWGIENPDLYIDNLDIYRNSLAYKGEVDQYLKTLTHILNNLKVKIYSPELLELDTKYAAYKAGNLDFKDYLSYLVQTAKQRLIDIKYFTNIYLLNQTLEQEKTIDFKKANMQRNALIDKLQKTLSRNELEELTRKSIAFKTERISQKDFYEYLSSKAKLANVDLKELPDLRNYIIYVSLYNAIDKSKVIEEIDTLENKIKDTLYQNEKQRQLSQLSKNLALMKNIFSVTLTKADYEYYRENESAFAVRNYISFINKEAPLFKISAKLDRDIKRLDHHRRAISKFYECSFKRDRAFLKNIRFSRFNTSKERDDRKAAIIVTGGFHTENLSDLFKENDISYIAVMPTFEDGKGYESPYFKLLGGGMGPLEKKVGATLSYIQIASPFTSLGEDVYDERGINRFDLTVLILGALEAGETVVVRRGDGRLFRFSGNVTKGVDVAEVEDITPDITVTDAGTLSFHTWIGQEYFGDRQLAGAEYRPVDADVLRRSSDFFRGIGRIDIADALEGLAEEDNDFGGKKVSLAVGLKGFAEHAGAQGIHVNGDIKDPAEQAALLVHGAIAYFFTDPDMSAEDLHQRASAFENLFRGRDLNERERALVAGLPMELNPVRAGMAAGRDLAQTLESWAEMPEDMKLDRIMGWMDTARGVTITDMYEGERAENTGVITRIHDEDEFGKAWFELQGEDPSVAIRIFLKDIQAAVPGEIGEVKVAAAIEAGEIAGEAVAPGMKAAPVEDLWKRRDYTDTTEEADAKRESNLALLREWFDKGQFLTIIARRSGAMGTFEMDYTGEILSIEGAGPSSIKIVFHDTEYDERAEIALDAILNATPAEPAGIGEAAVETVTEAPAPVAVAPAEAAEGATGWPKQSPGMIDPEILRKEVGFLQELLGERVIITQKGRGREEEPMILLGINETADYPHITVKDGNVEYPIIIANIDDIKPAKGALKDRIINPFYSQQAETVEEVLIPYADATLQAKLGKTGALKPGMREMYGEEFLRIKKEAPDEKALNKLREWVGVHERLIRANFKALETMGQKATDMDSKTLAAIIGFVDAMLKDYMSLAEDSLGTRGMFAGKIEYELIKNDIAYLAAKWEGIKEELRHPGRFSPEEFHDLIFKLTPPKEGVAGLDTEEARMQLGRLAELTTLHDMINYLHQRSFVPLFQLVQDTKGASASIELSDPKRRFPTIDLELIDVGETPAVYEDRVNSELLAASHGFFDAFMDVEINRTLIFKDNKLLAHLQLGAHSVGVHVELADPADGGMILVQYQEWAKARGNMMRIEYLKRILESLGLSTDVNEETLYLTARLDKDHGLKNIHQIKELLPEIMKVLIYTQDMNLVFYNRVMAFRGRERERGQEELIAKAVKVYQDNRKIEVSADRSNFKHLDSRAIENEETRRMINDWLGDLGLSPIPDEERLTQGVMDKYVKAPIEKALNAGRLIRKKNVLMKNGNYDPMGDMIDDLPAIPEDVSRLRATDRESVMSLTRMGDLATAIEDAVVFDSIGSIGSLLAQVGIMSVPKAGKDFQMTVLRDQNGVIRFARVAEKMDNGTFNRVGIDQLLDALELKGEIDIEESSDAVMAESLEKLKESWPEVSPPAIALSDGSSLEGSVHAGEKMARGETDFYQVTFEKQKWFDDGQKRILLAPFTSPEDTEYFGQYAGVIVSGGSANAHAGITAREIEIPGLIFKNILEVNRDGRTVWEIMDYFPDITKQRPNNRGLVAYEGIEPRPVTIEEGDWLSISGYEGTFTLVKNDRIDIESPFGERAAEAGAPEAEEPSAGREITEFTDIHFVEGEEDDQPVIPFEDIERAHSLITGGKALNLGRIASLAEELGFETVDFDKEGFRVAGFWNAPGAVVTVKGFYNFVVTSGIRDRIIEILRTPVSEMSWAGKSNRIRNLFVGKTEEGKDLSGAELTRYQDAKAELEREIDKLGLDEEGMFAVRSSNVAEDDEDAAFAGAGQTDLDVRKADVADKVVENFASFATARALQYRLKRGMALLPIGHAVVIQRMVESVRSGIIFSRNAAERGEKAEDVVIDAIWGYGEGAVGGLPVDRYVTNRTGEEVEKCRVGNKRWGYFRQEGGGTALENIKQADYLRTLAKRKQRVLSRAQVKRLSNIAMQIEKRYGMPVDIEFAINAQGKIYVLQVRAITTVIAEARQKMDMLGETALTDREIEILRSYADLEWYFPGQTIMEEGDRRDDGVYVVLSGEVEVSRAGRRLAALGEGEIFGAFAPIRGMRGSATVTVPEKAVVARIPGFLARGLYITNDDFRHYLNGEIGSRDEYELAAALWGAKDMPFLAIDMENGEMRGTELVVIDSGTVAEGVNEVLELAKEKGFPVERIKRVCITSGENLSEIFQDPADPEGGLVLSVNQAIFHARTRVREKLLMRIGHEMSRYLVRQREGVMDDVLEEGLATIIDFNSVIGAREGTPENEMLAGLAMDDILADLRAILNLRETRENPALERYLSRLMGAYIILENEGGISERVVDILITDLLGRGDDAEFRNELIRRTQRMGIVIHPAAVEVPRAGTIGKVTDRIGNVIESGLSAERIGETLRITHEDMDTINVPLATDEAGAIMTRDIEGVAESLAGFVGERDGMLPAARARVDQLIEALGDVREIVLLRPSPEQDNIKGVFSDNILYLDENLADNPFGLIHELGEGFVSLPVGEEFGALTRHTFMRGVGKDARIAFDALATEAGAEVMNALSPGELIERLDAKMRERPLTDSEKALILYNAGQNTADGQPLTGKALLFGVQDHLDPAGNAQFTQNIRLITNDLRRGVLNVFFMPSPDIPGAEPGMAVVAKGARKAFRKKYGSNTRVDYYTKGEDFSGELDDLVKWAQSENEKKKGELFPKVFVYCTTPDDLKRVNDYLEALPPDTRAQYRDMIMVGNDTEGEKRAIVDEVKVIAVGAALMNDKRLADFGLSPEDLFESRERLFNFLTTNGIIAEDISDDPAAYNKFLDDIWKGVVLLRITRVNWESIRDWKDAQDEVLRSL